MEKHKVTVKMKMIYSRILFKSVSDMIELVDEAYEGYSKMYIELTNKDFIVELEP